MTKDELRLLTLRHQLANMQRSEVADPALLNDLQDKIRFASRFAEVGATDREVDREPFPKLGVKYALTVDRLGTTGFLFGEPFFGGVELIDSTQPAGTNWEIELGPVLEFKEWAPPGVPEPPPRKVQTHLVKCVGGIGGLRYLCGVNSQTGEVRLAIQSSGAGYEGTRWSISPETDPSGHRCYSFVCMGDYGPMRDLGPDRNRVIMRHSYEPGGWWPIER